MGSVSTLATSLVAGWLVTGCFGPSLPQLSCAQDQICPTGLFCDTSDFTCQPTGSDRSDGGGSDGAAGSDASDLSPFCQDPDVVLCLEFEDAFSDGSARNNDVSLIGDGAAIYSDTAVAGRAIVFDGSYALMIPDYRPGSPSETIEFWMTVPPGNQLQIAVSSETEVKIGAETEEVIARSGLSTARSVKFGDNDFHHVAVRIEGGQIDLIVDGGGSTSSIMLIDNSATPDLHIGSDYGMDAYDGSIDSLRVWTRALSDVEIFNIAANMP